MELLEGLPPHRISVCVLLIKRYLWILSFLVLCLKQGLIPALGPHRHELSQRCDRALHPGILLRHLRSTLFLNNTDQSWLLCNDLCQGHLFI
jgi:hypothetical protein